MWSAYRRLANPLAALATLLLTLLITSAAWAANADPAPLLVHGGTLVGDNARIRLVLRFDGKPDPAWFLLSDPHRLVIDVARTNFDIDPGALLPEGLVSHVRYGNIGPDRSRIILQAKGPFVVDKVDVLENETDDGYRLIVDLGAGAASAFEAQLKRHTIAPAPVAAKDDDGVAKEDGPPRFTIALDPGHGGIDGGAQGVSGICEKDITLAFARQLRKQIEETGRFNVVMTRDDDVYVGLDQRVEIARAHDADLFISIHADAIGIKSVRGGTIYTVSDKASDAKAALTAARENLSDQLAGIEVQKEKDEVADILVDLVRRETHTFSIRFARALFGQLSQTIELVTNPHRYAGFRVLRAPDVPSVLIELGYLSNAKDEKELRDPAWRAKTAASIVAAVRKFAAATKRVDG